MIEAEEVLLEGKLVNICLLGQLEVCHIGNLGLGYFQSRYPLKKLSEPNLTFFFENFSM